MLKQCPFQTGACVTRSQRLFHVVVCLTFNCHFFLFPVSITTWWWLLQQLHQLRPQRIMTCSSTVTCRTAPPSSYGSSQERLQTAHWLLPTEAATAAAPVVWCLPAVCGTATKTGSETETGTAMPFQDYQGPPWKQQQLQQPFMVLYLTLSLLTRSTRNWKTRETSRTGVLCKYRRRRWKNTVLCTERKIYFQFYLSYVYKLRTLPVRRVPSVDIFLWILKTFSHLFMWSFD